jgi:hypothetical protein
MVTADADTACRQVGPASMPDVGTRRVLFNWRQF